MKPFDRLRMFYRRPSRCGWCRADLRGQKAVKYGGVLFCNDEHRQLWKDDTLAC